MSDMERRTRPTDVQQDSAPQAAPDADRDVVDDVLADFLGAPTAASGAEVTGSAAERPALRTVSAEEFVKRFRQETGQ